MPEIAQLAKILEDSRYGVALTGAGVSTDSGIPDFRGDAGLWQDEDPMAVASIDGFQADPVRFYRFWKGKFGSLVDARPNPAHRLLAGLEMRGRLHAVVTQNVDGLHQAAGSHRVLEVHGTFRKVRCLSCDHVEELPALFRRMPGEVVEAPQCQACGAPKLKPDVVLFGEMLPPAFAEAETEVDQCDVMLVLGSSLGVYPVAGLVPRAKRAGAKLVIINRDPTPFDEDADLVIRRELGQTSRTLMTMLGIA